MEDTAIQEDAAKAPVIPITSRQSAEAATAEDQEDSWTLQQTLFMLQRGHHPRDIAKMRNRTEGTILNHVMTLAARGRDFDLTPHLDASLLEELRQKVDGWRPGDPLGPIKETLDGECDLYDLKIHLVEITWK